MIPSILGMFVFLSPGTCSEQNTSVVYTFEQTVFGLSTGELDPTHPGPEVAVLLDDGSIAILSPSTGGWQLVHASEPTQTIEYMAFRPTIEIGDVHSSYEGNEVVIEAGLLVSCFFRNQQGEWKRETVFDGSNGGALRWGVRVGDIDPDHPGDEIYDSWEGFHDVGFGSIYRESAGTWEEEWTYIDGSVCMDSAIGDVDPDLPGNEIIMVSELGPTFELRRPTVSIGNEWPRVTIWDNEDQAGWVVKIADIEPDRPGNELAFGTRYSNSLAISRRIAPGEHELQVIFAGERTARTMWDIAVGDLWTASKELEIVGVDETGNLYAAWKSDGTWRGASLLELKGNPLNAVVMSDFDADRPGREILIGGQSGELILVEPVTPFFKLGDMNCDGVMDGRDIRAFVLAGIDPNVFATAYPACNCLAGDFDDDQTIAESDIAPFLSVLLAPAN
ncbi:MAG: hypothetical protein MI923_19400 [Phycisphaerales bacterium]|nr:hypothetical protein [Phycisphaerales bacterium]